MGSLIDEEAEFAELPPEQPPSSAKMPVELLENLESLGLTVQTLQCLDKLPATIEQIMVKRNDELMMLIEQQQEQLMQSLLGEPQGELPRKARFELPVLQPVPEADEAEELPKRTNKKKKTMEKSKTSNIAKIMAISEAPESEAEGNGKQKVDLRKLATVEEVLKQRGIGDSESSWDRRRKSLQSLHSDPGAYEEAKMVSAQKSDAAEKKSIVEDTTPNWQRQLREVVKSTPFSMFFAVAIVTNCILIGVQVEYAAINLQEETPDVFVVLSTLYAVVFLVELVVQVLAYGRSYFWATTGLAWNYLDLFIVMSSIVEFGITVAIPAEDAEAAGMSTSQLRILRVVRITRLARVVRIIKLVKFLRALRTLIYSILCTLKSLMWALVLVVLIMYVFAILLTDTVSSHLFENSGPWTADSQEAIMHEYFGSLHKSMHSLFRSITGGLTWYVAAEALASINWIWAYVFTLYVAFNTFAVLNVMTGVFCQSAVESAQRDQEMAIQSVLLNKQRFETALMDLFTQIDEDGSGRITISEFEAHFEDEAVKALLHALELEVTDAWTLFMMLDQDGDHDIDAEEFLDGCMHLKGTAKAIEVAKLKRRTDNITTKLETIEEDQARSNAMLEQIYQSTVHRFRPLPRAGSKDSAAPETVTWHC